MIHLTWSWTVCATIVSVGFAAGVFLGPLSWPDRMAAHRRLPLAISFIVAFATWVIFFGTLALGRILTGGVAELQATLLYLVFIVSGEAGMWLRVR